MHFDRNISENKNGKKNEGSYLSCVTNGEFYFSIVLQKIKPSNWRKLSDQKTLRVSMKCTLQGLVLTTNISEQWVETLSE